LLLGYGDGESVAGRSRADGIRKGTKTGNGVKDAGCAGGGGGRTTKVV